MAEHSSDHLRFPQWQPQYQAALMELNHILLLGRVTEAEYAIFERLQSLEGDHRTVNPALMNCWRLRTHWQAYDC